MSSAPFKAKAYLKEGCPFSFKFLVFALEAGLLDRVEIRRMREDAPDFEATKQRLSEGLGKAATFPTVEVAPGLYMSDSDRIIDYFAERHGLDPDEMPVLSFYKETIYPQVVELHAIKTGKA